MGLRFHFKTIARVFEITGTCYFDERSEKKSLKTMLASHLYKNFSIFDLEIIFICNCPGVHFKKIVFYRCGRMNSLLTRGSPLAREFSSASALGTGCLKFVFYGWPG